MTEYIMDDTTKHLLRTLLKNPDKDFFLKELAEESGVSRDALYRRKQPLHEIGVLEEKEGKYGLNQENDLNSSLKKILSKVGESGSQTA